MKFLSNLILASLMILSSACSNKPNSNLIESTSTDTITTSEKVELAELNGYFLKLRPDTIFVALLDSANFYNTMGVAMTMGKNKPTEIDFEKDIIGAIALPETYYETVIKVDTTSIDNRILNIHYSVSVIGEKRTFSIIPVNVFTINKELVLDSVAFLNNDNRIIMPMSK